MSFAGPDQAPRAESSFCPDGAYPAAGVIRDGAGNLYGTTSHGGTGGNGTLFMLDPSGSETVLHNFMSQKSGAYRPVAEVAMDSQGNLFGTTALGGAAQGGTLFHMLTPAAATATTLTSTPNPSTFGQPVTFTAIVTSGTGMPSNGETVSFMKGKTVLGTGTLSGGSASFTTSTLKVGSTSVTAVYGGDLKLSSSTSNVVKQVVKKAKK